MTIEGASGCELLLMNEEHNHTGHAMHGMEMSARGAGRPQMGGGGDDKGGSMMKMTAEDRMKMLHQHHKQTLWVYWTLIALGVWMVLAPLTFDLAKGNALPSGGRSIWLPLDMRATCMTWSDVLCGMGLIFFGWRTLKPDRPVSLWACCFIGIWLNMAPLLFWAPSAAAYLNDTLVGSLVIALSILIPGMPNMPMYMKMGGDVPPGWTYSPSSWPQRWIMILPCLAGWMVSRYLAAFQLGYIDHVWEPFFGAESLRVLNSEMSHSWPVSDGGLGAFSYTLEFLMGWMGTSSRWRTMPWMVAFFGVLVVPLGLTHIFLVISQPVVVGAWCSMCLLAAMIMLPMIAVELDEVMAMIQHMFDAKRRGEPMWQVFWFGGSAEGCTQDERQPEICELPAKPMGVLKASILGTSGAPGLLIAAAVGVWLMFSPAVFGTATPAAHIAHLGGALATVVAVICLTEVVRLGRYLNVPLGLIIALLPWWVEGATLASRINTLASGLLILAFSLPLGPRTERYGMWEKWVR